MPGDGTGIADRGHEHLRIPSRRGHVPSGVATIEQTVFGFSGRWPQNSRDWGVGKRRELGRSFGVGRCCDGETDLLNPTFTVRTLAGDTDQDNLVESVDGQCFR